MQMPSTLDSVREYYGKTLQTTGDLKTNACCTTDTLPSHVKAALSLIDDEILTRFYGCGSPLPPGLDGTSVLDLGCGTGRDAFVASKLVGPEGFVIGVDMTAEQLDVAQRHVDLQTARFGYTEPNIDFRLGYIEDLRTVGIEDNSIDVVISNCVINLSPEKRAVFEEILRVLKPGGELFFSDVFADRRIPSSISNDPELYGECLGGAMYTEDFRRMLRDIGVQDFRVVTSREITIDNEQIQRRVGNICFTSKTVRVFKLGDSIEDQCENYGQVAYYRGTIAENPHSFTLDDHHVFERNMPVTVCGNTAAMLEETRYGQHFTIVGDRSEHFGLFDCSPTSASVDPNDCGC